MLNKNLQNPATSTAVVINPVHPLLCDAALVSGESPRQMAVASVIHGRPHLWDLAEEVGASAWSGVFSFPF